MKWKALACAVVAVVVFTAVPAWASPHRPGPPRHHHGPGWGSPHFVPPHAGRHHRPPFHVPPHVHRHYYHYGPPVYRPYCPHSVWGPGGSFGVQRGGFGFHLRF
jgi:hypothetical protein